MKGFLYFGGQILGLCVLQNVLLLFLYRTRDEVSKQYENVFTTWLKVGEETFPLAILYLSI